MSKTKCGLKVLDNEQERFYQLDNRNTYLIGRSDKADIKLDNLQVSRNHAELSFKDGEWHIKDLGSTNGLKLDAQLITEHVLSNGDSIDICNSLCTFICSCDRDPDDTIYHEERFVEKDLKKDRVSKKKTQLIIICLVILFLILVGGVIGKYYYMQQGMTHVADPPIETAAEIAENEPSPIIQEDNKTNDVLTAPNYENVLELYRQGLLFYDNGHLKEAIELWHQALAYDSDNTMIRQKLARATRKLEASISQHMRNGRLHLKYLRYKEAKVEFMIVRELVDRNSEKYKEVEGYLEQIKIHE